MRLLKPAWVTHKDGKPIFSIDIHPDGSRFATGGQGDDTGKIIIWNMAPVREETDEKNENVPKILCEMDNHLACVNCVRWSTSGTFLASGGDDKLVMIWKISMYGVGSTVFGSDSKIVESWRPTYTLRGHTGDILGLAWSPGDVWLATCSIDNTIIVWNAEKFPEQVAVLKGHTGLVKGVTWDPVGKYLASQSDDKSLRIWRTRDWQQEAIVTEPFKECGGTTHVLRCDWSPDGHYVVSAHAMNNDGPTAQIVERDGWKTTLDFVGHRKAITVVRFNPSILCKKLKKDMSKPQQYTCCAIGSRDRSLSIWLTALKRPLVVTHDLFTNSVLDISWSANGSELLCCSNDGTVAYIKFKPEEIGIPMKKKDVNHLLEKIYGKIMTKSSSNSVVNQILESADILKLQQQQQQQNGTSPEDKIRLESSTMLTPTKPSSSFYKGVDMSNSPFKPTDKQIETKTADGRRRITPIFLSTQPDIGGVPAPYTTNSNQISFETSKTRTSIQIEKQDKVTHGGGFLPAPAPPASRASLTGSPVLSSKPPVSESTPRAATSTATCKSPESQGSDDGNVDNASVDAVVQPLSALENKNLDTSKITDTPKSSNAAKVNASPTARVSEKIKSLSLKRKRDKEDQPKKRGRPKLTDKGKYTLATTLHTSQEQIDDGDDHIVQNVWSLNLPVPNIGKHHNIQILRDAEDSVLTLEVDNYVHSGSATLHKLKCLRDGETIWEQVVSSEILAVAGSRHHTCVACSDSTLSVFNSIGQKVLPNIVLASQISLLDVNGHYMMAVTSSGNLSVWHIQKQSCAIKNEQLFTIMKAGDQVTKATVTQDGIPIVTLSTTKSYSFSPDLACWLLIHDKYDLVQQCSVHFLSKPKLSSKVSGTLSTLRISQERNHAPTHRILQSGPEIRQLSTLNHLESQVQICLHLKSAAEYKFWLQTYVRYLVQEGIEGRLREVCSDLLGPVYKTKGHNSWNHTILGFNKRDLLKELLPCFSENLKTLQRLYTELQDQLEIGENVT